MKAILLIPLLLSATMGGLAAQAPGVPDPAAEGTPEGRKGIWEATLPGGTYMVALNRVTSVSRHKYLLDGSLIVDEVTIDTTGQALVRFYHLTPAGGPPAVGDTVERNKGIFETPAVSPGGDLRDMVVKKYPDTTHARTVEYRLMSEQQLTGLFNSAKEAWLSGKGARYSVR